MQEIITLIIAGLMTRLLPHPANITAIGAIGLFSGARHGVRKGMLLTGLTMGISDAVLGFHPLMWATYGSFFAAVILGAVLLRRRTVLRVVTITTMSGVLFFIVTNFAVWTQGLLYPKTLTGLIACYIAAIPFLRNSLIGDLFYSTVLFGLEALGTVRSISGVALVRHRE
jgi:hypothetical protein